MKTLYPIVIMIVLLVGCQASQPLPTPEPKCGQNICLRQATSFIEKNTDTILWVQFEMTSLDGKSLPYNAKYPSELMFALYKVDNNVYLIGAKTPVSNNACKTVNDYPWAGGKLASACTLGFEMNTLAERPKVGDKLKIVVDTFSFEQIVILESR